MQFHRPKRRRKVPVWIFIGAAINVALAVSAHQDVSRTGTAVLTAREAPDAPILNALPERYRDWPLLSVANVGPPVNDLRAKLGNDVAIRAYREGRVPFPDGTIIVRLAWFAVHSKENDAAFRSQALAQGFTPGAAQSFVDASFVAGPAENIQIMVKDSAKFASTAGWGFAQFTNGKPDSIAVHACFSCHAPAGAHDYVFTHYAP